MEKNTFLASFGMIGLRLIEKFGLNSYRFAKRLGIHIKSTNNIDIRLPGNIVDAGFKSAMDQISDPAFALRAAECWHPSHFKALGYAWLASGSLYTALGRLERFICIPAGQALIKCQDTEAGLCVIYESGRGDNSLGHTMADFGLSLIISMCRVNMGGAVQLYSVNLKRSQPLDSSPYERFFQCDITFGAKADGFVLPWSVANRPLLTANADFAQIFDDILVGELEKISGADLVHRCKRYLIDNISSGEPSEDRLAEDMAMSRRTLQRKLAEHGLTYRIILDKIRHDMALKYLGTPDKSLTEIAFLLGFSEQSAFARAFRRWSGISPSTYRNT